MQLQAREFKWRLSVNKCSDVEWSGVIYVKWFYLEVEWSAVMVKFLGTKVPYTVGWPYAEGTWSYCDCFYLVCILYWGCFNLFCNVWVCVCVCGVGVFWQLCGYFGNMCTCIYCVLYSLYCVFVLFRLCIFILICFVCTSVRTAAIEWQLNCSKQ